MSTATDIKHIVRDADIYGGKPRIAGHRIAVHDIAAGHNSGYTPDQIVKDVYPALTLPEVYAALLYYYEHKDEIDAEIAAEDAEIRASQRGCFAVIREDPCSRRSAQASNRALGLDVSSTPSI